MALRPDSGSWLLHLRGFAITLTGHTTLGSTPLDEWSARRRDKTQHSQQTFMPPARYDLTFLASNRAASHPRLIDRTATGIGCSSVLTRLMYQCTCTEHKPPHNRQVSKSLGTVAPRHGTCFMWPFCRQDWARWLLECGRICDPIVIAVCTRCANSGDLVTGTHRYMPLLSWNAFRKFRPTALVWNGVICCPIDRGGNWHSGGDKETFRNGTVQDFLVTDCSVSAY